MVSALSHRKDAVKLASSLSLLERRNGNCLHDVRRIIKAVQGNDAEQDGQLVRATSEFADWNLYLIASMKQEIKTKFRLSHLDVAPQITPRWLQLENGKIRK
jgi:hypothetical protein